MQWIRGVIQQGIGYFEKRRREKQNETAQDRASRRTANATVTMAFFTALIFGAAIFQYLVFNGQLAIMRGQLEEAQKADIANNRAWIGPMGAILDGMPKATDPIKVKIALNNTGREPASFNRSMDMKLFSSNDWNYGVAIFYILQAEQQCIASPFQPNDVASVAFPTTGNTNYFLSWVSNSDDIPKEKRIVATDAFLRGDDKLVIQGCLVYRSADRDRHTSYCFYFWKGVSDPNNLSYCNVGQKAD